MVMKLLEEEQKQKTAVELIARKNKEKYIQQMEAANLRKKEEYIYEALVTRRLGTDEEREN
ncbi:uncharacterized protein G2W53_016876 [Senna tora]|uniref:Uncharacterized protein n=1 Tax=Senna tora TaxID=362788 RepID=A0A834WJX5_9FABA|nr:uncharacterized protein G2W53_016876 [Senna tora]